MLARVLRRAFALAGCIALLLVSGWARADPESDAKDLFARGRSLREGGNCAEAADLFRRAVAVFPGGLGSLRNLAECEEALGHWTSARRSWLDLHRSLSVTTDPKYAGWDSEAQSAAVRLDTKVGHLRIDVTLGPKGALPPDASVEVSLDGEIVHPALLGTEIERDPGEHVVRVEGATLVASAERRVTLAAGQSAVVPLVVTLRAVAAPPSALPEERDVERPAPALRVLGWSLVGLGGASLIAAGASLAVRQSALGDLERACPSYASMACSPSVASTVSRGQLASAMTTGFGVAGLVALGGGIALVLTSPKHPARVSVKARLLGLDVEEAF
jgi:hypothetical protein